MRLLAVILLSLVVLGCAEDKGRTTAACWLSVDRDDKAALDWYTKAAKQGHPLGQFNAATLLVMGETGVFLPNDSDAATQRYIQAYTWLELAAKAGRPVNAGPFEDGQAAYGRGDYATAMRLWRPLAEQGYANAEYHVGLMYEMGEGVPQDATEAALWYRDAAAQSHPMAQNNLGLMYQEGRGVAQDDAEAINWFRLSAQQNHYSAQFNLGLIYENGRGVPQDYPEATKWYRMAAKQSHAGAQNKLGVVYSLGRGVPRDYVFAHMWFNLAATQGDETARENRNSIAESMTTDQIAEAQRMARE